MRKLAENEYIIESTPYVFEKITIVGNNILWHSENKWLNVIREEENCYKIEEWKVFLKTIKEYSQYTEESFIRYHIKDWKVCKWDIKKQYPEHYDMYIKAYSEIIDWHELKDKDTANFIKEFAKKYKIFEMDDKEFMRYYHTTQKQKSKRFSIDPWTLIFLFTLWLFITFVIIIVSKSVKWH